MDYQSNLRIQDCKMSVLREVIWTFSLEQSLTFKKVPVLPVFFSKKLVPTLFCCCCGVHSQCHFLKMIWISEMSLMSCYLTWNTDPGTRTHSQFLKQQTTDESAGNSWKVEEAEIFVTPAGGFHVLAPRTMLAESWKANTEVFWVQWIASYSAPDGVGSAVNVHRIKMVFTLKPKQEKHKLDRHAQKNFRNCCMLVI